MELDKVQLEYRERLNFIKTIENNLEKFINVVTNPDMSNKEIQKTILSMLVLLPDTMKDADFLMELKTVVKVSHVDIRPSRGRTKLSVKYCKENKIPITKEIKHINYFRLFNAIINLLDRRQMLIKKEKLEVTSGKRLLKELKELEELEKDEEDEEELD